MSQIEAAILEARQHMNDRGKHWIKGALHRKVKGGAPGEQAHCSVGAINLVARHTDGVKRGDLIRAVAAALPPDYRPKPSYGRKVPTVRECESAIIRYNDSYHSKWGDISRLFRKAARAVRNAA